jgi:hypothetical protein
MPKIAKAAAAAKSPPRKKKKQALMFGEGSEWVQSFKREPTLVGSDIIMTEEIWSGATPAGMEDVWFHYVVTAYDGSTNSFVVTYQKQSIHKDGDQWSEDDDAERDPIPNVSVETVDKGIKLYNMKFTDVKERQMKEDDSKEAMLKKKAGEDDEDNMDDLDAAAESSEKGWFGQEVVELEFVLTGEKG